MEPLIIVGAGLAGWTTVREFRKLDTATPVVVVTQDSGDFYAKPSLSNAFAQKRSPEQLVSTPAAKMVETLNVTLLDHASVTQVDTASRSITLTQGDTVQTLAYGQLVLATGAQPIRVPVQGNAADQVRSINSLDDFKVVFSALSTQAASANSSEIDSKTVVIMGAGLIGCEFANDLVQSGYRVHVADPSSRPLAALLPEAASTQLANALQALGVQWHFGTTVQAVDRTESTLQVTLSNGDTLAAHAVLSAIGLRADTRIAANAGIAVERGILVNAQLRTSAAQVYALGDCAQYASAGQRTLPYVMPIMHAAKALAATLVGTSTVLEFPLMPVAIKTPAMPLVVVAAHPSIAGQWQADDPASTDAWIFVDEQGQQRGFVLSGKQTTRRMEFAKRTIS
jgi:rubredoxin---NAD+ reductase